MIRLSFFLCFLLAGLASSGADGSNDWPQWRGLDRTGTIPTTNWPADLKEPALSQQWRIELPSSYSGPIVVGDRVFVTGSTAEKTEVVLAVDRQSGKTLWKAEWPGWMTVPFFALSNGNWIRATPACDGESLYVAGMRDVLVCLAVDSGKERWRVDFVEQLKSELPAFGFVSSPLVVGDHVYVQAGGGLVKLDKKTGRIVWHSLKDGGGMNGSAFSSPVMVDLLGVPQLVVQTRDRLVGVDPKTGGEFWSQAVEAFRGMNIVTPTVIGNRIFTSSYGGGSYLFEVSRTGDAWSVTQVWRNKVQGYMSSPVVIDGHVYLHLRNQRFACLELATGTEKWISRPYGKYWSIVANGQRLLCLDEQGELLLIEATPDEFRLIDQRKITDQPAWGHLAVSGKQIFIRELSGLMVMKWGE
jgi:outer membrane protein assembly factor BamB